MKPSKQKFFASINKAKGYDKLNLSLVEDLQRIRRDTEIYADNLSISMEQIDMAKNSLTVDVEDLTPIVENLDSALNTFEVTASGLGIDVSDVSAYTDAKETYEYAVGNLNEAKKY
tara:strand:- start:77 stop:424 length:348 start_codon:yes stop_codon:yes gene_type:complete